MVGKEKKLRSWSRFSETCVCSFYLENNLKKLLELNRKANWVWIDILFIRRAHGKNHKEIFLSLLVISGKQI